MRKERENKVDGKLRYKIYKYEQPKQRVRYTVERMKRKKQNGGEISHYRH